MLLLLPEWLRRSCGVRSPPRAEALRPRGVGTASRTGLLQVRGQYQVKAEPPFVPGNEAAGEVCELGEQVTTLALGDRVITLRRGARTITEP